MPAIHRPEPVDGCAVLPAREVFHVVAGDSAVRDARERIVTVAAGWGVPLGRGALGDVKLCASEIITNALTHAGGECWVTTEWTGQYLRVAVTDRSLRLPVVSTECLDSRNGRGLALVAAFAHSWGWEPKQLGKVVHFLVAADSTLTGDRRLATLSRAFCTHVQADESRAALAAASSLPVRNPGGSVQQKGMTMAHSSTPAAPAAKGGLLVAARKIAAARARTEQPSDVSSGRSDGND